jgi:hypothetical protein
MMHIKPLHSSFWVKVGAQRIKSGSKMLNVSYQLVYFIIIKNIVKIAIINNYTNSKSLHDDGMKVVKFTN